MLLGEFLTVRTVALAEYALAVFAGFFAFVLVYEEPVLRAKFGDAYDHYCARVPRWIGFASLGRPHDTDRLNV